jgi:molybdenum cofactor cytidylyltransferase
MLERTVLILLAAGVSRRFGASSSKLDAILDGRALGLHVVHALRSVPFQARLAVTRHAAINFRDHGFSVVRNEDTVADMASSLRLGLDWACRQKAEAIVVALADMPRVDAAHILRLNAAAEGGETLVASTDGRKICPPAMFGRAHFDALRTVEGDRGARLLLQSARLVAAPPSMLVDVDTRAELDELHSVVPLFRDAGASAPPGALPTHAH